MISKRIETLVVNKCNIDVLINSFLKAHPQDLDFKLTQMIFYVTCFFIETTKQNYKFMKE